MGRLSKGWWKRRRRETALQDPTVGRDKMGWMNYRIHALGPGLPCSSANALQSEPRGTVGSSQLHTPEFKCIQ
jgi:hypothetical protein